MKGTGAHGQMQSGGAPSSCCPPPCWQRQKKRPPGLFGRSPPPRGGPNRAGPRGFRRHAPPRPSHPGGAAPAPGRRLTPGRRQPSRLPCLTWASGPRTGPARPRRPGGCVPPPGEARGQARRGLPWAAESGPAGPPKARSVGRWLPGLSSLGARFAISLCALLAPEILRHPSCRWQTLPSPPWPSLPTQGNGHRLWQHLVFSRSLFCFYKV